MYGSAKNQRNIFINMYAARQGMMPNTMHNLYLLLVWN